MNCHTIEFHCILSQATNNIVTQTAAARLREQDQITFSYHPAIVIIVAV